MFINKRKLIKRLTIIINRLLKECPLRKDASICQNCGRCDMILGIKITIGVVEEGIKEANENI